MTQFLQQIKPNGGEATFPEMWPNTTAPNDFVMDVMDNMEKTWLKGDQSQPNQSLDQYASTHRVSVKNNLATTQGENSLLNVGIGSVVIVSWGPNSNYLTS